MEILTPSPSEVRPPWKLTDKRPRSISLVPLAGDNLARFIYADESGISSKEAVSVVAAVIVNADKEYEPVENYVKELITEYVPKEHREGFVFRGSDLFHGTGRTLFDRRTFPLSRSKEALKKIVEIPRHFKLPVAWGFISKKHAFSRVRQLKPREQAAVYHAFTYAFCALSAERFMREHTDREAATFVAELNTDTQQAVKNMCRLLRGKLVNELGGQMTYEMLSSLRPKYLPIRQIKDEVFFTEKDGAFLMQIADACALVLRYYIESKPNCEEFYEAIAPDRSLPSQDLNTHPGGMRLLHWRNNG